MNERDIATYINQKVADARRIHEESFVPPESPSQYSLGWYRKSLETAVSETGVGPELRDLIWLLADMSSCSLSGMSDQEFGEIAKSYGG